MRTAIIVGLLISSILFFGFFMADPSERSLSPDGGAAATIAKLEPRVTRQFDGEIPEAPGNFPLMVAREPMDIRTVLRYTRDAGPETAAELTEVALTSPDPLVVGAAMKGLARLGTSTDRDRIAGLLKDERPSVRQEAVRWLGQTRDAAMVPEVLKLVDHEDATLRRLAIQALGRLGGVEAGRRLRSIISSPRSDTVDRAFAQQALRVCG